MRRLIYSVYPVKHTTSTQQQSNASQCDFAQYMEAPCSLPKAHAWRIFVPIVLGLILTAFAAITYYVHVRRKHGAERKYLWPSSTFHGFLRLIGLLPKRRRVRSGSLNSLTIEMDDDVVGLTSSQDQRYHHVCLKSQPILGVDHLDGRQGLSKTFWKSKWWPTPWNPFKRKPVPVISGAPGDGFRIDSDVTSNVTAISRLSSSSSDGFEETQEIFRTTPMLEANISNSCLSGDMSESPGESDTEDDKNGREEGERVSLISPNRNVMLISRYTGVDFSIYSSSHSTKYDVTPHSPVRGDDPSDSRFPWLSLPESRDQNLEDDFEDRFNPSGISRQTLTEDNPFGAQLPVSSLTPSAPTPRKLLPPVPPTKPSLESHIPASCFSHTRAISINNIRRLPAIPRQVSGGLSVQDPPTVLVRSLPPPIPPTPIISPPLPPH